MRKLFKHSNPQQPTFSSAAETHLSKNYPIPKYAAADSFQRTSPSLIPKYL